MERMAYKEISTVLGGEAAGQVETAVFDFW